MKYGLTVFGSIVMACTVTSRASAPVKASISAADIH